MNQQQMLLACLATALTVLFGYKPVLQVWDRVSSAKIRDLSDRIRALHMDDKQVAFLMRLWGGAMAGTFILVWFIMGMPTVAVVLVFLIYKSPRLLLTSAIRRRSYLLRDQLVGAGIGLANACRSGLSLAQAFEAVTKDIPDPLKSELSRIVGEYHAGRPLREALLATKERLNLDSFSLLVSAVLVCMERGGNLTEALDRISRSLQENQRLERKLEADTQSGRMVVIVLCVFPFLFLGGFYVIDPEGTSLMFTTVLGQIVLAGVILCVFAAGRMAQKILSIEL
ncbi:MAG: type II secretion system F family protein [Planctomycetales bacterium]